MGKGLRLDPEGSVRRSHYNEFLKEDISLCAQSGRKSCYPGKFYKTWSLLEAGRAGKKGRNGGIPHFWFPWQAEWGGG